MRDDIRELQDTLTATQFACVPPGVQSTTDDIYPAVKDAYPELCDDSLRCDEVCDSGADQPEWKHAVRRVQQQLGRRANTRLIPHDTHGKWQVEHSQLFLIPVSDDWIEEFRTTVKSPVNSDEGAPSSIEPLLPARIWGSTDGSQTQQYFDTMRPCDCLLFYFDGDFFAGGTVGRTVEDPAVGSWLWNNPDSRFIFTIAEFYEWAPAIQRVWDTLGYNGSPRVQGFMRVKPDRLENLRGKEKTLEYTLFGTSSWSGSLADDNESASIVDGYSFDSPQRTTTSQDRLLRDQNLIAELKSLYDHTCQVCGYRLQSGAETGYSEVHHIKPLGEPHSGPDVPENMLVCCPNHHADFDNGMLSVDPETYAISHAYDDSVSGTQLTLRGDHQIRSAFLKYHNDTVVA
ncbi:HNH endonuclease [Halorubrum ezzemoulense]|uniref:HNH endonuclease n=2 Tax=Halorubrum ezzemoulense TaxID=337243 RepID=UPI00232E3113|nr:HNH endonuclease [Halorubrum ezzemoulense]MDB2283269.1 HNH endonuclease [Halorubrum ezzemoulense]